MGKRDDELTLVLPPEAVPAIEAALSAYRRRRRTRRNLAAEIAAHLAENGPRASDEIRRAIRARGADVRQTLKDDTRFALLAHPPPSHRAGAKCWTLARSFSPTVPAPGTSNAEEVGD